MRSLDWTKLARTNRHKYSAAELRELYRGCPTPEMRKALWEIKRLQGIVKKANQLCRALSGIGPQEVDLILVTLMMMLRDEPCLREDSIQAVIAAMERDKAGKEGQ